MCGRYALYGPQSRLREAFLLEFCPEYFARYNIAPQSRVLIIRHKPDTGRTGQLVRWGLIPSWAKDPGSFFAFAGLLAAWKAPDGATIVTTCIITTAANDLMAPIHDRMPAILRPEQYDAWLDPGNSDAGSLEAMIGPCSSESMCAFPVSPEINRGDVEGAACIEPMAV